MARPHRAGGDGEGGAAGGAGRGRQQQQQGHRHLHGHYCLTSSPASLACRDIIYTDTIQYTFTSESLNQPMLQQTIYLPVMGVSCLYVV